MARYGEYGREYNIKVNSEINNLTEHVQGGCMHSTQINHTTIIPVQLTHYYYY